MTGSPMVSTYSMWSLFRNCRKAVDWRYLQHLAPLERDRNLHFGSIIHECLQVWHQSRDLAEVAHHLAAGAGHLLALVGTLAGVAGARPHHAVDDLLWRIEVAAR